MAHSTHTSSELAYAGGSLKHFLDGTIDFTAGSLGGVALVYVGQPLDTIKVKMQTFPHLYKNMFTCLGETLRADGITRGLYAGTVPALIANVAENSILFMAYGFCQKFMANVTHTDKIEHLSTFSNASAGFLAAFFSSVAICPTELVKCKLQAMHETQKVEVAQGKTVHYVGPMQLTRQILRLQGVAGLFNGFVPTIAREMPGYFFFFGGYEGMRYLLTKPNQSKDNIGLWRTMVAGAVGGIIFWTTTYPIDVAKSRIQVSGSQDYLHTMLVNIVRREGFSALYNGLTPTLVRTVPATATLFVTYEYTKKFLHFLAD